MIKKILIGLAVLVIAFVVVVATRPADFRVERSATLAASPSALFEHVNNHHKFNEWNPFMKLDPNVKNTYSGPESGVGAVCSWDGNKDIGAGSLHDHREQTGRTRPLPDGLETANGRHSHS